MKRLLLGFLIGVVVSSIAPMWAAAQNWRFGGPLRTGQQTCRLYLAGFNGDQQTIDRIVGPDWVGDVTAALQLHLRHMHWMDGFVSGVAYERGEVFIADRLQFDEWFLHDCQAHPDATMNATAGRMVEALMPRR